MANNYQKKTDSGKAYRSIALYSLLTLLVMFLMIRFGTVFLLKFTNYLGTMAGREDATVETNSTKPITPTVEEIPAYTNKESIRITGKSQPGMDIVVVVNEQKKEVLADAEGEFNAQVNLSKISTNTIYAYAVDNVGLESNQSKSYSVQFDDKPPTLEIISPSSGTTFYLETERNQRIEGQTEDGATVKINDRIVIINNENKFNFPIRLENGENKFTLIATDEAGNETKIEDYSLKLEL